MTTLGGALTHMLMPRLLCMCLPLVSAVIVAVHLGVLFFLTRADALVRVRGAGSVVWVNPTVRRKY